MMFSPEIVIFIIACHMYVGQYVPVCFPKYLETVLKSDLPVLTAIPSAYGAPTAYLISAAARWGG
jgi:hypothetical protein